MSISTKLAAIITTVVAVGTYLTTQSILALAPIYVVIITAVVVAATAYETAENT